MNKIYTHLIQTPCRIIFSGPSGSGKSELVKRILENNSEIFFPKIPAKILYCCKESCPNWSFSEPNFTLSFVSEIPSLEDIESNSLIIVDDFMEELSKQQQLLSLFVRSSRHRGISVFLLVQNFFYKNMRNLTLNATHIVLFKSPRDSSFISPLSRQIFPRNPKYLEASFEDSTKQPYGYLLINTTQEQDENLRLSSSFFQEEAKVYMPLK
jgi:hypothetical protein